MPSPCLWKVHGITTGGISTIQTSAPALGLNSWIQLSPPLSPHTATPQEPFLHLPGSYTSLRRSEPAAAVSTGLSPRPTCLCLGHCPPSSSSYSPPDHLCQPPEPEVGLDGSPVSFSLPSVQGTADAPCKPGLIFYSLLCPGCSWGKPESLRIFSVFVKHLGQAHDTKGSRMNLHAHNTCLMPPGQPLLTTCPLPLTGGHGLYHSDVFFRCYVYNGASKHS